MLKSVMWIIGVFKKTSPNLPYATAVGNTDLIFMSLWFNFLANKIVVTAICSKKEGRFHFRNAVFFCGRKTTLYGYRFTECNLSNLIKTFYLKGCLGFVFTHGVQMGGCVGGRVDGL